MNMVQWSDEYSVEIQEIDEQHKCIVKYINELYEALSRKDNHDLVADVIHKLVEYTKIHFAVEETLMRIFHYAGYEAHKAIHDRLVQQALIYQGRFLAGDNSVGMELLIFLKEWLFTHISNVDKQYVITFHAAGVKKSWLRKFW
ncbi:MAG TPA: bacteriohemerythrin [Gammaproteobacteria bacterium]